MSKEMPGQSDRLPLINFFPLFQSSVNRKVKPNTGSSIGLVRAPSCWQPFGLYQSGTRPGLDGKERQLSLESVQRRGLVAIEILQFKHPLHGNGDGDDRW